MTKINSDAHTKPEPEPDTQVSPKRRRPYQKPVLTEYGPVSNLTQSMATGSIADGGGMMMTCL